MNKRWLLFWIVIIASSQYTNAQLLPPVNHDSVRAYTPNKAYKYKDPQKAFLLSLGNTVVPVLTGTMILSRTTNNDSKLLRIGAGALIVYGMIIGPSTGLYYAGSNEKASGGILGRLGATALGIAGTFWGITIGIGNAYDADNPKSQAIPSVMIYSGAILLTGSAVLQIIKAPAEARKHNRSVHLAFSPTYYPREKTPGLAINIRF